MDHSIDIEKRVFTDLLRLGKDLNLPPLATNDLHYTFHNDAAAHEVLLCIQSGSTLADPKRFKFENSEFYLKTASQMRTLFKDIPESCDNTLIIAERCDITMREGENLLPRFEVPAGETEDSWLVKVANKGLAEKLNSNIPVEYQERLNFELDVMIKMGFPGYFLVVSDLCSHARKVGIRVGPGRGSAAGSLVSYALGITGLDPIKFGLLFERFLNPERISMPDIDLDFDERRRSEMIQYATTKYGDDRVAQIITYGTIKSKQAIKDSTRVLGYPYALGERLTKSLPPSVMGKDISLSGIFDVEDDRYSEASEFRNLYASDIDSKKIVDTARGIEGLKRQWGVHAAGVILSKEPLLDVIPIHRREADGAVITQFDMGACEAIGLLKMDFLGLRNLSVLDDCLVNIEKNLGKKVVLRKVAGFTLGRADLLRKAMGKKNKEILDKERVHFEQGMKSNGFSEDAIEKLWQTLIPFSDYAFNRAHSAGYGLLSFWTAYLKANYPTEYMAALLTSVRDDKDKSALYLNECRRMGIKVLPPDVNESDSEYTPIGEDIRFGLTAIRNVGENVVASIIKNRIDKNRYLNFGDFLSKVDSIVCNKKSIESLIKAGAFDSLGHTRRGLMMVYPEALDAISETKRAESIGQFDLFGGSTATTSVSGVELDIPTTEWDKMVLLGYEREMLGLYVSDHPLLGVEHVLKSVSDFTISQISEVGHDQVITICGLITQIQRKVSKQGAPWAIVTVEDLEGAIDVLFFSNSYSTHGVNLVEDRIVAIRGRVDKREEQPRVSALDLSIPDLNIVPTGPFVISMEMARCTPPVIDRVKEILRSHPGGREVHLRLADGEKNTILKLDEALKVTSSPSLSADLKTVLGPDCLVG